MKPRSPKPEGVSFFDVRTSKEMVLCLDVNNSWYGWLVYLHENGSDWVSLRKAKDEDLLAIIKILWERVPHQ